LAASTAGSTPLTGRTRPSSANSPSSTVFSSRSHADLPCAESTAAAGAMSKVTLMLFYAHPIRSHRNLDMPISYFDQKNPDRPGGG
jgi:hypothetical protein